MTVRSLYPADRPSLLLNFAKARALDTRVSFTRASTGTYVGADGLIKTAKLNEARFDSNPITGEGLGLLVEEARTNYILQSGNISTLNQADGSLSTSTWRQDGFGPGPYGTITLTPNSGLAPDGSLTATRMTLTGLNATSSTYIQKTQVHDASRPLGSPGTYTMSIWIKSNTGSNQTAQRGVVVYSGSASASGSPFITTITPEWQRFALTYTVFTIGNIRPLYVGAGLGNSLDILIWGASLEVGSLPTSYIPTTASTVTRAADVVTVQEPFFSSLWNPSGGTFLVNYTTPASETRPILSVDNNTTSNRIELYTSGTSQKYTVTSGGATQCDLTTGTVAANNIYRLSAAYASNDFSSVLNGATPVTASSGTVPTVNRLRIGSNQAGNFAVSTIARIAYYPIRYPNTQLQGITTT